MTTAIADNYAARVDRDRRPHERDCTLYLLAMFARAARHSLHAVRLGHDPVNAAMDVIIGDDRIGQPGIAAGLEPLLTAAYEAGQRRADLEGNRGLLELDDRKPDIPLHAASSIRNTSASYARQAAGIVRDGLTDAMRVASKGVKGLLSTVKGWWRKSGLVLSEGTKAAKATAAGVAMSIAAFNAGSDDGFAAMPFVLGYSFDATLDERTTEICSACDGVKLPPDHPWWRNHRPMLHWGCRSIRRPIFKPFTATIDPPQIEPTPGFGTGGVGLS